mgnify:CR=1 FL=1
MFLDMFSPETFAAQFATTLPPEMTDNEEKLQLAGQIMSDAIMEILPEIEAAMLKSVVKHFTLEELQAMYDFYSTDLGASIMRKSSVYFVDAMADINPRVLEVSTNAKPEILAILQVE